MRMITGNRVPASTIRPVVMSVQNTRVFHYWHYPNHRKHGILLSVVLIYSFAFAGCCLLQQSIVIIVVENEGHRDQRTRHVYQTILCDTPALICHSATPASSRRVGAGWQLAIAFVTQIGYWRSWNGIEQGLIYGKVIRRSGFSKSLQKLYARTTNGEKRFCLC